MYFIYKRVRGGAFLFISDVPEFVTFERERRKLYPSKEAADKSCRELNEVETRGGGSPQWKVAETNAVCA